MVLRLKKKGLAQAELWIGRSGNEWTSYFRIGLASEEYRQ